VLECCQCEAIAEEFSAKTAGKDLKEYRSKGLAQTTRLLVDHLVSMGIEGSRLLDVSGGVGAIQHELLKKGASSAVNIDGSSAYQAACEEEALRQGHSGRISYHFGDYATMEELEPVDIVTMEKVVCCYPNMNALVTRAAADSQRLIGLVFPRNRWWVRAIFLPTFNLVQRLLGREFRAFFHEPSEIRRILDGRGFRESFTAHTRFWTVAIYSLDTGAVE